ncbi:MAG TPA: aminotransferase class I/II-fold pyridoxal phosphate-dependent enzyme, partial [bacterium]|nr:aminotransferase class I/II-fold pyridoxal phosphate-dependent enzyme [bacterium]
PDLTTPDIIVQEMIDEVKNPSNQNYPSSMGEDFFREGVARWNKVRYGVDLDPKTEVSHVIGGKEGVSDIARAYINPGDMVLCPDPGYPVYINGATNLCDGHPYIMPLKKENNFLPDLEAIEGNILKKAKMMYLNYPNNPTGATAPIEFLKEASDYAEDYNFIIVYDNPYSEFTFEDYIAPSILQVNNNHIEINSASKMFNMTGFRCGWVAGNAEIISGLRKVKSQVDSGGSIFIQKAVIKGLNEYNSSEKPDILIKNLETYENRRNILVQGLNKLGWKTDLPKATFYVWTQIPEKFCDLSCFDFIKKLLDVGVIITPGTGFGKNGEGFVRFTLTQPEERIREALERIEKLLN